jgi:hypothetical protein
METILFQLSPGQFNGDNIPATYANLLSPNDIKSDTLGNLFISDGTGCRIRLLNVTTGLLTTFLGGLSCGFSTRIETSPTTLATPNGLWLDTLSNLYVLEGGQTAGIMVRKVIRSSNSPPSASPTATPLMNNNFLQPVAGVDSTAYSGSNGPATLAQIVPRQIWIDPAGNIYVAEDLPSYRIRKINTAGIISVVGGTGTTASTGGSGPITSMNFYHPYSVVGDAAGTFLYISDYFYVWKYVFSSGIVSVIAGTATKGYSGDGGPSASAQLYGPKGLWLTTGGLLYIADYDNGRVRLISSSGIISTAAGCACISACSCVFLYSGSATANNVFLSQPVSVYVDTSGKMFIADYQNLKIFSVINNILTTFAGSGGANFNGDNIPATLASLYNPIDVKGDTAGNIYIVTDTANRIRVINIAGIINTIVGNGQKGYSSGLAPVLSAIYTLSSMWIDSMNILYISEAFTIRKTVNSFSSSPSAPPTLFPYQEVISGTWVSGYSGDNGAATLAQMNPNNFWVDPEGNMYIADQGTLNFRIRKVDSITGIITTFGGSSTTSSSGAGGPIAATNFFQPFSVIGDLAGTTLFVSDSKYVWIYSFSSGIVSVFAGISTSGFLGDGAAANLAKLSSPKGLWLTTGGNLYIADSGNNRIRMIVNGIISTVAGSTCPGGSFSGDTGAATSACLKTPVNCYVDSVGNLFIADSLNNRVRMVGATNNIISTYAGNGYTVYNGDNLPATLASINGVNDVKGDSLGNIYIADLTNCVVRMVIPSLIITTVVGTGGKCYLAQSFSLASEGVGTINALWIDSAGSIYFNSARKSIHKTMTLTTPAPSSRPSSPPSRHPSSNPTNQPSSLPSSQPISIPSGQPSLQPTGQPSTRPSFRPSGQPTSKPLSNPTSQPSNQPSSLPSRRPTNQPSNHPTSQPSAVPSRQPISFPTCRPSSRPSLIPTSPTSQPSSHPSRQPLPEPTSVPSHQPTSPPTRQPSSQPTFQPQSKPTNQPSNRPTAHPTVQPSSVPSKQPVSSPTSFPNTVPSSQPTVRPSKQPTSQPTSKPSIQPSSHPSSRPSVQPSRAPSSQPLSRPTSQPSLTPSTQPSIRPSCQPTGQPNSKPSNQPSSNPSSKPSSGPSGQPTNQPSSHPSVAPTNQPSTQPSCQPTGQPASFPSSEPSTKPSRQPTSRPTEQPTVQPSSRPSHQPSSQPSVQPSLQPSNQPTSQPTSIPSDLPTTQPTSFPTNQPSESPTDQPSSLPSSQPTNVPSSFPSSQPTNIPSSFPSVQPSNQPTAHPSRFPTSQPSGFPSSQPTMIPSMRPTIQPTSNPSDQPTTVPSIQPSSNPTSQPTSSPSNHPTCQPSSDPTRQPTCYPSSQPSKNPSNQPTSVPSSQPTVIPTGKPSGQPSNQPTCNPSYQPTSLPSIQPTSFPTEQPSSFPSDQPTSSPSRQPSSSPSLQPFSAPTVIPSCQPTARPTSFPSNHPTTIPSKQPNSFPTSCPTRQPTMIPSKQPNSFPTSRPSEQPTTIPTAQPFPLPTSAPVAEIHLTKGVLFFLGDSIYSSTGSTTNELLGESYILFGRNFKHKGTFPAVLSLSSNKEFVSLPLNDSTSGISSDVVTRATTILGDINNDGVLDFMVGLPLESKCLVYLGTSFGSVEVTESFSIIGDPEQGSGQLGWASTRVGDLNHDGFDEIVVSALFANTVYFVYGRKEFKKDIIINNLLPEEGFHVIGGDEDTKFGVALSLIHDFNKDGYQDIAITAVRAGGANVVYILLGNANFGKGDIQIDQLIASDPTSCFRIFAPYLSYAGYSISGIGDINNDGYNDLAIGSIPINNAKYGEQRTYIIYGREINIRKNDFYLSEMTDKDGFIVVGGGFFVGGVGDVNNDGFADMMITSYYNWKGKGNAYLINYPKNVPYSPTFQPSSFPSFLPSSSPSTSPSLFSSTHFPTTNAPNSEGTTDQPVSESSFPPFLQTTQCPTRIPTMKPSTVSPTINTNPTLSPSRNPTASPTKKPVIIPAKTQAPSRYPTERPTAAVVIYPTSFPSSIPTDSPVIQTSVQTPSQAPIQTITIGTAGNYNVPNGNGNYVISSVGNIQITGNGGKKIYTILPSKNIITITDFSQKYDQINFIHFPDLHSINDLVYTTNPLQFTLSTEQTLILSSVDITDLTEESFLFRSINDSKREKLVFQFDITSIISLAILVGCIGVFGCLGQMNQQDEDDCDSPLKESFEEKRSGLVIDVENDWSDESEMNITEEFSENNRNLFGSFRSLFSSEDDGIDSMDTLEQWLDLKNDNFISEVDGETEEREEEEELSDLGTENSDQQETGDDDHDVDIEGNYQENDQDDEMEEDISLIRRLFSSYGPGK